MSKNPAIEVILVTFLSGAHVVQRVSASGFVGSEKNPGLRAATGGQSGREEAAKVILASVLRAWYPENPTNPVRTYG
jgi:hypothetical protein